MGKFYAFHKSVRGHLHIMKDIPCEDWSESYADEGGQFYIAVVADGHGDTACMRSAKGSRKAAKIAKECLEQFAKAALSEQDDEGGQGIGGQLKSGRYMDVLRPLTGTIVSEWSNWVMEELSSEELTEEELNKAGSYADAYRNGEKLLHVYGTTLLAALMLPDYLILLQQGDGRCVVFYEDGTVEEPITLDERCHENVTTSMCDVDAPLSLLKHSVVIPLRDKKVMACWLGCDGVEDSYRNIEGTYTFYRELICELNARKENGFDAYLTEYLPKFSKMGSGDDVSVSGIVDMDCIEAFAPSFLLQAEEYGLKEDLERLNNKLLSMSRKHGLLQEQAEETKKLYERLKTLQDRGDLNDWQKAKASEKVMDAQKAYQEASDEYKAYDGDYKKIQEQMEEVKGQLQDCMRRSSQLAQEAKQNRELKKQKLKTEMTKQDSIETHDGPEMHDDSETHDGPEIHDGSETQKKTDGKKGMLSGVVEILNREVVNQRVGIMLLMIVLILALIVLLLSMWLMGTGQVITSEQCKGAFGKILGKMV